MTAPGKCNGYLSAMVDYLAAVGDVISTWDDGPTEGHNYFAMLGQSPQEILSILVTSSCFLCCSRHNKAHENCSVMAYVT